MSYTDDSHILSKLGILESTEKSPRKNDLLQTKKVQAQPSKPEAKKFVDVKLDDKDESTGEEDVLFDRDGLISSPTNFRTRRKRTENEFIFMIMLLLFSFIAGTSTVLNASLSCSVQSYIEFCLCSCAGIIFGCYSVRYTIFNLNILLSMFIQLIFYYIGVIFPLGSYMTAFSNGVFQGTIIYGGTMVWFGLWRNQPRRLLTFVLLISLGSLFGMLQMSDGMDNMNSRIQTLTSNGFNLNRHVRSVIGSDETQPLATFNEFQANATLEETTTAVSEDLKPKKPESAIGDETKVKTKTEINDEKIEEVQKKTEQKENELLSTDEAAMMINATDEIVTKMLETTSTTSTTSTTPTTTTTTSTTPPTTITTTPSTTTTTTSTNPPPQRPTITEYHNPNKNIWQQAGDFKRGIGTEPPTVGPPVCRVDQTIGASMIGLFVMVVVIYVISYATLCMPFTTKPSEKIRKLENENRFVLSIRLRVALAAAQTMIGFLEQTSHFHLLFDDVKTAKINHLDACVTTLCVALVLVVVGKRCGSVLFLTILTTVHLLSHLIFLFNSGSRFASATCSTSLFALRLVLLLLIENQLHPKATIQLAYYAIAWATGRVFACLVAYFTRSSSVATIVAFALVCSIFYIVKMVLKAVRMKEIMENSGGLNINAMASNEGAEYINLTAADFSDDEEMLSNDERDSMDLDFELQELGLGGLEHQK